MDLDVSVLWNTLQSSLAGQIPQLLGALAILLLGWLIALILRAGARKGLNFLGVNRRFEQITGQSINIEKAVSVGLFWIVLLFVLTAVFNLFDLSLASGPFAALLTRLFEYVPSLLAGSLLALLAWLIASVVRVVVSKTLSKTSLDEKLSKHAGMVPISSSLSQALFWLVILLFVPAILGALQVEGLLSPLREMVAELLDILPNALAAFIIGGIGWIIAVVLRNITTNLLRLAGADQVGQRAGLKESMQLSNLVGLLVFVLIILPAFIAALDALKIETVSKPATDMLRMMLAAIPHLAAAGLILFITWLVASFASRLLASLLSTFGFDNLPQHVGLAHAFEKTSASSFVGRIALFFAMLFATVEAANQLGFGQVGDMVGIFIRFGGDVLLGSLILIIGFWLANLAYEAIDRASGPATKGLARIGRIAILSLVLAMGLRAMGIADDIVNLAFGLTLGAIAVAVALSFGLGGREAAGELMKNWLSKFHSEKD